MKVVLYVDDNVDELLIFEAACRLARVRFHGHTSEESADALRYLLGEGSYADRLRYPLPALVLLDVKMAGLDGFELLSRIRSTPALADIPVVLFTSSVLPDEATRAARHGALACVSKPVDIGRTADLVRALDAGLDAPETLAERLREYIAG